MVVLREGLNCTVGKSLLIVNLCQMIINLQSKFVERGLFDATKPKNNFFYFEEKKWVKVSSTDSTGEL